MLQEVWRSKSVDFIHFPHQAQHMYVNKGFLRGLHRAKWCKTMMLNEESFPYVQCGLAGADAVAPRRTQAAILASPRQAAYETWPWVG